MTAPNARDGDDIAQAWRLADELRERVATLEAALRDLMVLLDSPPHMLREIQAIDRIPEPARPSTPLSRARQALRAAGGDGEGDVG